MAVVAKRHPMLDEVPVAFLRCTPVTDAERGALTQAIEAACASELAGFKRPRELHIVEELPRSTLEKINKAALRAMLKAAD